MVKKAKKSSGRAAADAPLSDAVKASARQIWLAGMGAFAKAQAEGGKAFESLVQEGVELQRKTQAATEERMSAWAGKMSAAAGEMASRTGSTWDQLEAKVGKGAGDAMKRLGAASAADVTALTQRVDALVLEVARLAKQRKADAGLAAPKATKPTKVSKSAKAGKPAKAAKPATRSRSTSASSSAAAPKPRRPRSA